MVRLAKAFTRAHIVGPNLSPRPDSPALSVTETKQRPVRKEANEYRANLLVRVAAAYEFQATSAQKQPKDGRYQARLMRFTSSTTPWKRSLSMIRDLLHVTGSR